MPCDDLHAAFETRPTLRQSPSHVRQRVMVSALGACFITCAPSMVEGFQGGSTMKSLAMAMVAAAAMIAATGPAQAGEKSNVPVSRSAANMK